MEYASNLDINTIAIEIIIFTAQMKIEIVKEIIFFRKKLAFSKSKKYKEKRILFNFPPFQFLICLNRE